MPLSKDARHIAIHKLIVGALAIFLCMLATGVLPLYALTPAHTLIENRAMATYPWEGAIRTTWSEWVSVRVLQVAGIEMRPDSTGGEPGTPGFIPASEQTAQPGAWVYMPYRLRNLGNGTDTFTLTVDYRAGADDLLPPLHDLTVFYDRDDDGQIGPRDESVQEISLIPGEDVSLILAFRIPQSAADGDSYYVSLQAQSHVDPAVRTGDAWSMVHVRTEGPIVRVHRTVQLVAGTWPNAPVEQPSPAAGEGATMLHTIVIENVSDVSTSRTLLVEALDPSEQLLQNWSELVLLVDGVEVVAYPMADAAGREVIELSLGSLLPGAQRMVEYKTLVAWQDDRQTIQKTARIDYALGQGEMRTAWSNEIVVHRELHYAIELFPAGRPPYMGEAPKHHRQRVYASEKAYFATTVKNAGTMAGTILMTQTAPVPPGWTVSVVGADGVTPLPPGTVSGWVDLGYFPPGAERDVMLLVDIPEDEALYGTDPYFFELVAAFGDRPEVTAILPVVIDRVYPIEYLWDPLRLEVDLTGVAVPGMDLTYTLEFGNAAEVDITNVRVVIQLSPLLDFLELVNVSVLVPSPPDEVLPAASAGEAPTIRFLDYDAELHAVVWEVSHIPSQGRGSVRYRTRVRPSVAPGSIIEVQGILKSAATQLVAVSNLVTNVVLPMELLVTMTADEPVVTIGDGNGYHVHVANLNPISDLADVEVLVQLPPGLTYRKGSSLLDGVRIQDPELEGRMLRYRIAHIAAEGASQVSFGTIVNAHADYELTVVAQASVQREDGDTIASEPAAVRTLVLRGIFSDEGLIVGKVAAHDGTPLSGIRVFLDNGRFSVTDSAGRYSFAGVAPGPRVLRLDPTTLPGKAWNAGLGQSPLLRVVVPQGGIASADFVLPLTSIDVQTSDAMYEGEDGP